MRARRARKTKMAAGGDYTSYLNALITPAYLEDRVRLRDTRARAATVRRRNEWRFATLLLATRVLTLDELLGGDRGHASGTAVEIYDEDERSDEEDVGGGGDGEPRRRRRVLYTQYKPTGLAADEYEYQYRLYGVPRSALLADDQLELPLAPDRRRWPAPSIDDDASTGGYAVHTFVDPRRAAYVAADGSLRNVVRAIVDEDDAEQVEALEFSGYDGTHVYDDDEDDDALRVEREFAQPLDDASEYRRARVSGRTVLVDRYHVPRVPALYLVDERWHRTAPESATPLALLRLARDWSTLTNDRAAGEPADYQQRALLEVLRMSYKDVVPPGTPAPLNYADFKRSAVRIVERARRRRFSTQQREALDSDVRQRSEQLHRRRREKKVARALRVTNYCGLGYVALVRRRRQRDAATGEFVERSPSDRRAAGLNQRGESMDADSPWTRVPPVAAGAEQHAEYDALPLALATEQFLRHYRALLFSSTGAPRLWSLSAAEWPAYLLHVERELVTRHYLNTH
jgi:hypothetical protein